MKYAPLSFIAILFKLLCDYTPVMLKDADFKGTKKDFLAFISSFSKEYTFVEIESKKDYCKIFLNEYGLTTAKDYLISYSKNFKNDDLKDEVTNHYSYKASLYRFIDSIDKMRNMKDYKLVAGEYLLIILSAWIDKLIEIERFDIVPSDCENEDYLKCSMTLNLQEFSKKHFSKYSYGMPTGKYTKKQKALLDRIIEIKREHIPWIQPCIDSTEIAQIYDFKYENSKEINHRITEIVRKLNKAFEKETGRKILGRRFENEHYPILYT